ncbi:hypothetical protein LTSEALA_1333 [Salmonella enterica subsp. enterica serovar Alachua str. R6-377]|uniref:Uncharacterized protein n=1 Tax=Salmonella enterica subsp. enterica serovar Alachua str. R6-377 TaxID=913241 RepID=G5LLI2_SALET|nr:hypothetical protein LTSEALA_1333 [Salmonella enterica subsp. enterica serovar Alachua str. R6-377]
MFSPARGDPTADRGDAGGAVLPGVNARGIYAYPIVLARTRVVI